MWNGHCGLMAAQEYRLPRFSSTQLYEARNDVPDEISVGACASALRPMIPVIMTIARTENLVTLFMRIHSKETPRTSETPDEAERGAQRDWLNLPAWELCNGSSLMLGALPGQERAQAPVHGSGVLQGIK